MDPHSTNDKPPQASSMPLHSVLGGLIAVLTIALPIYITAHYSSSAAWVNTPPTSSAPLKTVPATR